MSVTTYDNMRMELWEDLNKCLKKSRKMLDEEIWGYSDMEDNYAIDLYMAIKKARDSI